MREALTLIKPGGSAGCEDAKGSGQPGSRMVDDVPGSAPDEPGATTRGRWRPARSRCRAADPDAAAPRTPHARHLEPPESWC
jgi:hypothetical protein